MKEIWKISKSEPHLEVSSEGNVRYSDKNRKGTPYTRVHKAGYIYVQWTKSANGYKKTINRKVHRLVAEMFCDNPEQKPCVNHKNGIKSDNRCVNLEYCTHLENMRHAYEKGLIPSLRGEMNGRAALNEELVHKICQDYCKGLMPSDVIAKYKITRNQATKIKSKYTWKHITDQYKY